LSEAAIPSIDTFFPSVRSVSTRPVCPGRVAPTDSELNFRRPTSRGSKSPAAIEAGELRWPLQRPEQLLPQHVGATARGRWGVVAGAIDDHRSRCRGFEPLYGYG
jgi:hypothetical protein